MKEAFKGHSSISVAQIKASFRGHYGHACLLLLLHACTSSFTVKGNECVSHVWRDPGQPTGVKEPGLEGVTLSQGISEICLPLGCWLFSCLAWLLPHSSAQRCHRTVLRIAWRERATLTSRLENPWEDSDWLLGAGDVVLGLGLSRLCTPLLPGR